MTLKFLIPMESSILRSIGDIAVIMLNFWKNPDFKNLLILGFILHEILPSILASYSVF